MKNALSPIANLVDSDEDFRWGFDAIKPVGQPQAWIEDWDAVSPGFDISETEAGMALAYEIPRIGDVPVGQILATHSLFTKLYWHTTLAMVSSVSGEDKAREIAARVGSDVGLPAWNPMQPGSPNMELGEIAWRLDASSLLSGSWNKSYTWADDEKVVTASTNDFLKPPTGMEATQDLYQITMAKAFEGCLSTSPGLLSASHSAPADGERPARNLRMWTYIQDVIDALPDEWERP